MPKQTNYEEEEMGGEEAAAMDMGGAAPMGSADYDASGRGSYDASGRGEQDAGTETIPDNIAMMNQASIAAKSLAYNPATVYVPQMGAEEVAEHVSAMFDGEDLSEEFVVSLKLLLTAKSMSMLVWLMNHTHKH